MPEVPKIVYDRLRAGLAAGSVKEAAHPDPDMLTAFSERSLPAVEREGVLQHLARCGDCRELVALSIPPTDSGAQPATAEENESTVPVSSNVRKAGEQRAWFAWPNLRWAALAAGLIVAGGVLLIHPGKPNAVPESKPQPASTVTESAETVVAQKAVPAPDKNLRTRNSEKKPPTNWVVGRDRESKLAYAPAAPAKRAGARRPAQTRKDLVVGGTAGAAVGAMQANSAPVPSVPAASETIEVTSGPVTAEEARDELPVTGRQVTAPMIISKAKEAKTGSNAPSSQQTESLDKKQMKADTTARQQGAVTSMNGMVFNMLVQVPAQWAIHGNDLQRSLDAGVGWTTVFHSDRPLLSYAAGGNDVWAGGKAGDLFHSADGGLTWSPVHPSAQQRTLSDDVTHIDVSGPSQIALFTSNNQSWNTADGGKTWTKK